MPETRELFKKLTKVFEREKEKAEGKRAEG